MVLVARKNLQAGMVTEKDVLDQRNRLLILAGTELTDKHLHALNMWGIASVHIRDENDAAGAAGNQGPSEEAIEQARNQTVLLFRRNTGNLNHPLLLELQRQCTLTLASGKDPGPSKPAEAPPVQAGNGPARRSGVPSVEELVKGCKSVTTLPEVYNQLMEVVHHPRSSLKDIADVMSSDQGLTARLLRIVNSVFYGFTHEVQTVSRAAAIVGTNELCELALSTSVTQMFQKALGTRFDMRQFWRHGIWCGAIARQLAAQRGESSSERHFVAGLLHDIGLLILQAEAPDLVHESLALAAAESLSQEEAEHKLLGFTHADLGGALLKTWRLPPSQVEAVQHHHHPLRARTFPLETALIHVANLIAGCAHRGYHGSVPLCAFEPKAWDLLQVPQAPIATLIENADIQVNRLAAILGVE